MRRATPLPALDRRHTGRTRSFHGVYGFITPDDPSLGDVFVHFSGLRPTKVSQHRVLLQGQYVEFAITPAPSGGRCRWAAIDVVVVEESARIESSSSPTI